mgnify:CR=1 FL=1
MRWPLSAFTASEVRQNRVTHAPASVNPTSTTARPASDTSVP